MICRRSAWSRVGSPLLFASLLLVACASTEDADVSAEQLGEATQELGAPYALGAGSGAGSSWTRFSPSGSTLYAAPIVPARAARLSALRIVAAAAGGSCRLGLYDEANGRPARLLASATTNALVSGTNSVVPGSLPDLSPGVRYWVGALCSSSARLYRQAQAGQSYYAAFASFLRPLPTAFPTQVTQNNGTALGWYALVADLDEPRCTAGSRRCSGAGRVEVCTASGSWATSEICAPGSSCNAGQCAPLPSSCVPGSAGPCVSATTASVCSASGTLVAVACVNQTCIVDACVGECLIGTRRCGGAGRVEVCTNSATWAATELCGTGTTCAAGACVPISTECTPGSRRCGAGGAVEVCTAAGIWAQLQLCASGLRCISGACAP